MNNLDRQYQALLQDILENGTTKETRNGGTISVFGRQIRHKMSDGFPLLTTKKMAWRQIIVELLWFLRGDTNIKFLIDNNCHIWDGDTYKNYDNIQSTRHAINEARNMVSMNGSKPLEYTKPLSQEDFINNIKTDDDFAKEWGELGPIYGAQWRKWDDIDQIANIIHDLKANPDSRRMMVNAWNVDCLEDMLLPPCHYGFQVYTRELDLEERRSMVSQIMFNEVYTGGDPSTLSHHEIDHWNIPKRTISLMWNQRSVDTPLGLPFNIASYGLLLTILGKMFNMVPDELIGNLGDTHIYLNQIDGVKEQLTREPYSLPKLNINTEWWPTDSGECGIGNIDAHAVLNGFSDLNFCKCLLEEDIQLYNYQSHPTIKFPLSN
jgi:thymidylate synthase